MRIFNTKFNFSQLKSLLEKEIIPQRKESTSTLNQSLFL